MSELATPTRTARRNFWLGVADGGMFSFGLSIMSRFTVLPLIVEQLSGERWMQGLIPAIFFTGWLLPALFVTPAIIARPRRKPWLMVVGIGERLPYLLLGLLLLFAPTLSDQILLVAFFSLFAISSFCMGLNSIAWQDFIARIVSPQRWGTFLGLNAGFGGTLGVGGALIAGIVLVQWPFPQSIGLLSLCSFACMVVSFFMLSLMRETPQPTAPAQSFQRFLRGLVPLLRSDVAFRRYLVARSAISLGLVGHSFFTAAALERFQPAEAEIALYTAALLGVQALANVGLGALADHWGHKHVLLLSTLIGVVAIILAVVAPVSWWFVPIFALVGASQAGFQLSGFTLVFAFSPPADRPRYIGIANTALAPIAAVSPMLVGWLATITSYDLVFILLALMGTLGAAILHWRVAAPPRHTAEGQG
jgi:MFS family permease